MTLLSSDGVRFTVNKSIYCRIGPIKDMLDLSFVCDENTVIPLNISGRILELLIKWITKFPTEYNKSVSTEEDTKWCQNFLNCMTLDERCDVLNGTNYLVIEDCKNTLCELISDEMRGKTYLQIRTDYGISSGFTKEEEEENNRLNEWNEEFAF